MFVYELICLYSILFAKNAAACVGNGSLFALLQVLRASDDPPSWTSDHSERLAFLRRFSGTLRWILRTICRCLLLSLHTLPSGFGMCVLLRYEDRQSVAWILVHSVVVIRVEFSFRRCFSLDIPVTTLVYRNKVPLAEEWCESDRKVANGNTPEETSENGAGLCHACGKSKTTGRGCINSRIWILVPFWKGWTAWFRTSSVVHMDSEMMNISRQWSI